jgi:hypothetical protein
MFGNYKKLFGLNVCNTFCDTHTQFVILKIFLCMAINLNKIKLIKFRILVKNKFCVCTSSKTLEFFNYFSWIDTSTSSQKVWN